VNKLWASLAPDSVKKSVNDWSKLENQEQLLFKI